MFGDQMQRLEARSDRLRYALTSLYMAFTCFVGTSLALAIDAMLRNWLMAVPTLLAVAGVAFAAICFCVNLVLETLTALRSNRLGNAVLSQSPSSFRHAVLAIVVVQPCDARR